MNDNQGHRPITSKARGICKYYTTVRGCFAGNSCKFLHISESSDSTPVLTPYDKAKRCRFYANGYCKRGDQCWFLHVVDPPMQGAKDGGSVEEEDDDVYCSICFERPVTFGLLDGCSHIFCIECIRQWRDPTGKTIDAVASGNTKKCPMCRASSRYIIPSSRFWKEGQEDKARTNQRYKQSMSRVPCKHFTESKLRDPAKPMCLFGKDCFYQHLNSDGSPHIFKDGTDASIRAYRKTARRFRAPFEFEDFGIEQNISVPLHVEFSVPMTGSGPPTDIDAMNLAGNIAMDMFDRMMTEIMNGVTGTTGSRGRGRRGRGRWANSRGSRRGEIDEAMINRARRGMMAGAMTAIQNDLNRQGEPRVRLGGEEIGAPRPVVVPETLSPAEWDLDGDGEGDNGWGWNELLFDTGANGNPDIRERLELLADHMLGSLRVLGGQDRETPPPQLEPIGRGMTPSPHLVTTDHENIDNEDEIPALESVSSSSSSDGNNERDSDSEQEEDYREDADGETESAMRAFDPTFNDPLRDEERSEVWPLFQVWNQLPTHTTDVSSRFSTTVEREVERTDIDTDEDSEDVEETNASPVVASEPSFVTDGRGRVVWSNKATETVEVPSSDNTQQKADHCSIG